jgi:hypothetical protein
VLVDHLMSDPVVAKSGLMTADLRGRISKATKFTARRDFAMAADELSNSVDNVNRALPFARLPYNECWFEVAQEDRRSFADAPLEGGDCKILRVGYLLTLLDHEGSWSAQLFWSFAPTEIIAGMMLPPTTAARKLIFDMRKAVASGDVVEAISFPKADGVALFTDSHAPVPGPLQRLFERASGLSDWVGEPGYIIATLALLNSRNASEVVPVDRTKQNKRRKLVGKPLLFDYHELCIPQRYKQRNVPSAGEDPAQLRARFVRGHWKVRKTGVFFWNAYQRGNIKLGFVHKDYVLDRLMQDAHQ